MRTGTTIAAIGVLVLWTSWAAADEAGPSQTVQAFSPMRFTTQALDARGLTPTGLEPAYPTGADCPRMTSAFASEYRTDGSRRSRRFFAGRHGGIDIPAEPGTPVLAVASGTLVHMAEGGGIGGLGVVLQHAPEDTGFPVWVYTEYKHLQALPDVPLGTRYRQGQTVGLAGTTGTTGGHYGEEGFSHLHLAAFQAPTGEYVAQRLLIPKDGAWLDPLALFGPGPKPSAELADLTDKKVAFAHVDGQGHVVPPGATVTWPFACGEK